jgi:hypothetical protein
MAQSKEKSLGLAWMLRKADNCTGKFKPMRLVTKISWIALVWATGASTLLAGVPYTACACSLTAGENTGRRRQEGSCCAAHSKCDSHAPAKTATCCSKANKAHKSTHQAASAKRSESRKNDPTQIAARSCNKTTPKTPAPATTRIENSSNDRSGPLHLSFVPTPCMALTSPQTNAIARSWHSSDPPPTNLIIAFQHFVI